MAQYEMRKFMQVCVCQRDAESKSCNSYWGLLDYVTSGSLLGLGLGRPRQTYEDRWL